jgi:hypothetical protein
MKTLFSLFEKISPVRKKLATPTGLPGPGSVEVIDADDAQLLRGGDKEYTPPFYENVAQANWSKPNLLLND